MELFKLLGTIAVDNSAAKKSLDEVSETGGKTESKLSKAFGAVGKGAVAVGKTVAAGIGVASGAVTAFVTKSVQSYADYEQLVGGVDTLFKDSSAKVQEYAKNAFKTAGLSANEYMETVTSFSAALLQSLDGDTAKAAEKANLAITDMSDNANKMGTDMALIQNAYQGFAKQNYTMLDNLKLGYGGTKEEMARLLADAEKLSGQKFDLSSYADIVEAIHVVQTEMGITGTTAKEAASTISGSLGMMKSSWQNLLTAMSSDELPFDEYVNSFVDSVATVADNLMPRIQVALNGVVSLIDKLAPVIIGKIPELFNTLLPAVVNAATGLMSSFVDALPGLVDALMGMLPALIKGVQQVINGLISALPKIIKTLVKALPTLIRFVSNALEDVFVTLCTMLPEIIQPIIEAIPDLIQLLVGCIIDSLPGIIEGIMELCTGLIEMLPTLVPMLMDAIVSIVEMIVYNLPDIITMLLDATISLVNMLAEQLPVLIPFLADALVKIITMLTEQLPVIIPMLIDATITIVLAIVEALPTIIMALINALPPILQAVWDAIVMVFQNLPQWFGQIFSGAVEIIKAFWSPVANWINTNVVQPVVNFFKGLWDGIKAVWDGICNVVRIAIQLIASIFDAAFKIITLPFRFIWENCKEYVFAAFEWIKEKIGIAIDFIKNIVQIGFGFVKDKIINPIIEAKDKVVDAFEKVKSNVQEKITAVKNKVSEIFGNIKTKISDTVNNIKTTVTNVFSKIKDAMEKPIEKARDTIKGIVDKIKGFFDFEIKLPKIKLPHFSIKPSGWKLGDLLEGSIPSLGIDWYAKAMNNPLVMDKPTIFGYDQTTGRLQGGGERGSEVVAGTNTLMGMIGNAVEGRMAAYTDRVVDVLVSVLNAIVGGNEELLNALLAGQTIKIGEREFARAVREYA